MYTGIYLYIQLYSRSSANTCSTTVQVHEHQGCGYGCAVQCSACKVRYLVPTGEPTSSGFHTVYMYSKKICKYILQQVIDSTNPPLPSL